LERWSYHSASAALAVRPEYDNMPTVTDDLPYIAQPLRHLAVPIGTLMLDPAKRAPAR
jgi:hypothetical protein